MTTLHELVADRSRIADVAPEDVPTYLGELEAVRAELWRRLQAQPVLAASVSQNGADRLLTAAEAAERLRTSKHWVYRHRDTLPFAKRLPGGTLRFSEKGLEKWQARR